MAFERILLPVDGNPDEAVVTQGVRHAAEADATIHVLYVVDERLFPDPRPLHDDAFSDTATDELEAHYERVGERAMATVEGLLSEEQSGSDVVTKIERGTPDEVIPRYATENDIEVIVMAKHDRTTPRDTHLGSVTERVIREAGTPVFVIPPAITARQ